MNCATPQGLRHEIRAVPDVPVRHAIRTPVFCDSSLNLSPRGSLTGLPRGLLSLHMRPSLARTPNGSSPESRTEIGARSFA